jgi:two-component system cell cycle response regulator DivK
MPLSPTNEHRIESRAPRTPTTENRPAPDPASAASAPPLILIIEDDDHTRELYAEYLAFAGFRVDTARDGFEGIGKAVARHPDIIVTDLLMPHLDGWEATRRLKAMSATRDIPVVALSAVHSSRESARAAGCDGFLAKPCLPDMLLCEVRLLLAEKVLREIETGTAPFSEEPT